MFWKTLRRYLLNLILIPWIFVWGLYGVYFVLLSLFQNSFSRRSVELPLLEYTDVDLLTTNLFVYSLVFAGLSYTCAFFLKTIYPRVTSVAVVSNLLLLVFLLIIQWPALVHLLNGL